MKVWCNCGITQLYVKCGEWITANDELKLKMACCQDQCPKLMSCGHRYEKPLKIHIKFFYSILDVVQEVLQKFRIQLMRFYQLLKELQKKYLRKNQLRVLIRP